MKKIFIAMLGVLALFACANDSNLDEYKKKQAELLEIALAKPSDFFIYSGGTTLFNGNGNSNAPARLTRTTTPEPEFPGDGFMKLSDAPVQDGRYMMQDYYDYRVLSGENLTASLDVSNAPTKITIHVQSGATLNITSGHNGSSHVIIKVYKGGTLNYGWNGPSDGSLIVGNGGTAEILCWGKIGVFKNNWQTTDCINKVEIKAGSTLKIYNTGDMSSFDIHGDLFAEQGTKSDFYSEIPVNVDGQLQSNSGTFIFDNNFTAGGISTNSGSNITFRKCASVSGDVHMSGESDIYVDSYFSVGRIAFDQGRMHLNSAMFDAGIITIPAEGGNAYIEATNNDLSIVKSGQIRLSNFVDANYKTTALKGNLVVVCTDVTNGNTGWNGNAINIGNLGVESGVRFNPATSTYYLPAENNCRPANPEFGSCWCWP